MEIPLNISLPNDTSASTTNVINVQKSYVLPKLDKPLKSTCHLRTLKEFAKSGSSPIQCVDSMQREPFKMSVRDYLQKFNIQTFEFQLGSS
jgi:hypothetical protein